MKDQFIGMDIKQKVIIKIQQNNINIFSNQTLLGLIFVLVYLNRNNDVRYYLPKRIMKKLLWPRNLFWYETILRI